MDSICHTLYCIFLALWYTLTINWIYIFDNLVAKALVEPSIQKSVPGDEESRRTHRKAELR